ncbi:MAG TPA: SDR family oxidoreductase [Candidatus Limnocylindrales bacterium]|nr:SDR family oxidoreductase [Candidatus Limnocylindrales bacterium]
MNYHRLQSSLESAPRTWLVTGAAGFIGSNLLEALLRLGQNVVGLDNFSTGHQSNLDEVRAAVGPLRWARARIVEGDIRDLETCRGVCAGVDCVLHQAALGSVPRSIADPIRSHESNVTGFLNMLVAARDANVRRFVYASSSSIYGDEPRLPKVEERVGQPLSPYAATKVMNEVYAGVFARTFGLPCIGLRYFNVFGPRQDPAGPYAAVIPRWIAALLQHQPVHIYGDGETSRDFSFVENVVQANLLAACTVNPAAFNQTFNIAIGETTTLNQLFHAILKILRRMDNSVLEQKPIYNEFRPGDVRHSHAAIEKAQRLLGYSPTHRIGEGLELAMNWYRQKFQSRNKIAARLAVSSWAEEAVSCSIGSQVSLE